MNNNPYPSLTGGDYPIDYLILSKLPITDIIILCKYAEYFSPICADDYFWNIVVNYHFPGVSPTAVTNWLQLVKFLTSNEVKNVNRGLNISSQTGNISLVKYFISK